MKYLICLGHPAQFHLFKNIISELNKRNHETKVLITDKDILSVHKDSMLEYEHGPLMEYTPYTHQTAGLLTSLADLKPKTLATMHGSSFYGNCSQVLTDLNLVMKEIWGGEDKAGDARTIPDQVHASR